MCVRALVGSGGTRCGWYPVLRLRGSAALHCIRPSLTNPTPMLIPSSLHTAVPLVTNRSYSYVNPDSPVFTLPRTPLCRYYHWKPTNATLVWDRLPMTLAFMTVFAIMIDERLGAGIGGKVRSYFVHTPTRPSDHTSCSRARIGRATVGNDGESRRHMSRIFRGEIKSLPLPPLHVLILHFFLSVFLPFPPLSSLLSVSLSFCPSVFPSFRPPKVLLPLLVTGLASVVYWAQTDDLRPYVLVQGIPLIAIPVLIAAYPARYSGGKKKKTMACR